MTQRSCKENDAVIFSGIFGPKNIFRREISEYSPAAKMGPGSFLKYSVYGLLWGMRGSRIISQTRGLSGCGCSRPCATRISAERIALSRLWRAFGPQMRMSRELTVGLGHLSSHPKSASANCLGCCLVFSSAGAGRPRASRSKMVVIRLGILAGVLVGRVWVYSEILVADRDRVA